DRWHGQRKEVTNGSRGLVECRTDGLASVFKGSRSGGTTMTHLSFCVRRLACAVLMLMSLGGAALAQEDWKQAWEKTVSAAKAEGKVIVGMAPRVDQRNFLIKQWQQDFPDIELSLSIISSSKFIQTMIVERQAGKYLWDVWNSGPNRNLA